MLPSEGFADRSQDLGRGLPQRCGLGQRAGGGVLRMQAADRLALGEPGCQAAASLAEVNFWNSPGTGRVDASRKRKEDWLAFGATLRAAGAGRVVETKGDVADHEMGGDVVDPDEVKRNPKSLMGNDVVIDHGNGEHSVMAHMTQGSLGVNAGDRVERGQPIGEVGLSGDAYMVHVHHELVSGTAFDVEGLPSSFSGFAWAVGSRSIPAPRRPLDTGEILEVR